MSTAFLHLTGKKGLIAAVGVVIAAAAALLLGDAHSIGMTHN